jgi:hypothetical protein
VWVCGCVWVPQTCQTRRLCTEKETLAFPDNMHHDSTSESNTDPNTERQGCQLVYLRSPLTLFSQVNSNTFQSLVHFGKRVLLFESKGVNWCTGGGGGGGGAI